MDGVAIELRGNGLTLRSPVDADASLVADAVQRSLTELHPWMPWASSGYDSEIAAKWIRGGVRRCAPLRDGRRGRRSHRLVWPQSSR